MLILTKVNLVFLQSHFVNFLFLLQAEIDYIVRSYNS
jgi:hypothetical protein